MATAIRTTKAAMMDDRLKDAAKEANRQGYLLTKEYNKLKKGYGMEVKKPNSRRNLDAAIRRLVFLPDMVILCPYFCHIWQK